jgi:type I restriction enzyme, S subunit
MASDARKFAELYAEGTRNGLTRPKAVRGAGVKMVNMGELFAYPRLRNAPMDRVPLSNAEADRFLLEPGDLLFARQSLVLEGAGKCSIFLHDDEPVTFESHVTRVRLNSNIADPLFYFYYLQSHQGRSAITSIVEQGAGASGIRGSDLATLDVLWLPLPEQRAIAAVLGALDDKIEQNRRTARALERLAQAIFRAWFVDFEPVKAKAAGATAFPSMCQEVFDGLPTRFVDSEIGPVPEGWDVRAIGDVVMAKGGGTPSTKNPDFWDGGEHCWATPKDMSRLSHPVLLKTERRITDEGVNSISSGILPVGTVLMSSRAPVGYLAIAGVPTAINQGFIAMVCDGSLPPTYVLNWAFTSMDAIKAHASGTTFPEISKKNFRPLPIIVPTSEVIGAYQQMADPLYELLTASVNEGQRLASVRDYLLPQLLSGAVRVRL